MVASDAYHDAIPRGYVVDHDAPEEFVVRCTECGHLATVDDRGKAHRRADNHALYCSSTGVCPVRPLDGVDAGDRRDEELPPTVVSGWLNPYAENIVGETVAVGYEPVSKHATSQRVECVVTAMVVAPALGVPYRGFEFELPDGRVRRVDLVDDAIRCPHGGGTWRCMGTLQRIEPVFGVGRPVEAVADGGREVSR